MRKTKKSSDDCLNFKSFASYDKVYTQNKRENEKSKFKRFSALLHCLPKPQIMEAKFIELKSINHFFIATDFKHEQCFAINFQKRKNGKSAWAVTNSLLVSTLKMLSDANLFTYK